MDTITKINKAKTSVKGTITRIEKFVENESKDTISTTELDVKLKKINQLQTKLDELKTSSFALEITDEELSEFEKDVEQCEIRLEELEVSLKNLYYKFDKKCETSVIDDCRNKIETLSKTKIPPIVLPTFSGKYEHFSNFKNQFDDLITHNKQLSQSQKLYYLNSCLSNEVKEFALTFDTFTSLYEALESRYDNKRLIVDIHIGSILNFKKIERESAVEIREMIDCIKKNLRALKVLKYEQNDLFDVFLQNIMLKKLDKESRKNFEILQKTKEVPTFDEFIIFLEQREAVLLSVDRNCFFESKTITKKPYNFPAKNKVVLVNENFVNKNCIICSNGSHPVYRCEKYMKLTPRKRFELVKLKNLCELCLNKGHRKDQCRSSYTCSCGLRHSKTICFTSFSQNKDRQEPLMNSATCSSSNKSSTFDSVAPFTHSKGDGEIQNKKGPETTSTVLSNVYESKMNHSKGKKSVLLSTACIFLQRSDGNRIKVRALLDSCSNINILSRKASEYIGIKKEKIFAPISGLNGVTQNIKWKLNTSISNEDMSFNEPIEFLIVDKITGLTPSVELNITDEKIPDFLPLADSEFHKMSEIGALINADLYLRILKDNQYRINDLVFRESEFGWIAGGKLNETQNTNQNLCCLSMEQNSLENSLSHFFELEGLGIKDDPVSHEEDQALNIFNETIEFKQGRYVVQLPFRKNYEELSDNFSVAKRRLQSLWRRFRKNPNLHLEYKNIIEDYLKEGIVERIEPVTVDSERPVYFLPHQAVKKDDRVTTKTRIVFDASSHQNEELSLNDCLWQGPNLNPNLLDVLIQFRLNKVAICSDIQQAFLQICIAEQHKDAVRFLWAENELSHFGELNIQTYRFNRVLFGVNSSPFLLAATIKHHIEKYRNEHPETVKKLDTCFYVDDFVSGGNNTEEALVLSRESKNIMKEAGMMLRKWISNDYALMENWKLEGFDTNPPDTSSSSKTNLTKVLGIKWNSQEDYLTLEVQGLLELIREDKNSKRFILMAVGKLFDPLGLITPYTIKIKCLIQELWKRKIAWDESLPPEITKIWKTLCAELSLLNKLKVPRLVLDSVHEETEDIIELHSFCDASKKAYGASIYLRVKKRDKIIVNLVTSKSRVTPLKNITLPRLELLGALVAARLSNKVQEIMNKRKPFVIYHWTDSKVALYWIRGSSKKWKSFVANRVQEITKLTDRESWFHCSGKSNPADILSRGTSVESLLQDTMWWNGPPFLVSDQPLETDNEFSVKEEEYLPELKNLKSNDCDDPVTLTLKLDKTFLESIINRSNKFLTVIRICSYLYRFLNNSKFPQNKKVGPLTAAELSVAENYLIGQLQREEFSTELATLRTRGDISRKSKIFNLSPYLDNQGIMRVGGRLENSQLPYSSKHPVLLPSKGKFSEMIVRYYHEKYFHLGPQHLLFQVRQKYWPIHGRNLCKKIVHNCVACFKANPKQYSQKMGNLPKHRITPDKVFNSTGIDLCGPFLIKNKNQRKGPEIKVYVCIFICLVTKAVHLELISDLTSQALIATLKRFASRRGKCHRIYSDNGTNMVGANRELNSLFKIVRNQDESLFAFFAEEKIEWSFIPPRSPNWGGLWEANIKAFKYHFKRVAGNSKFTYEELLTLITQIEAILNSRPLIPLTSDVEDLEVLTPAHFLIGRPITAIVEPSLTNIETNRLNSWQRITKSVQTIWKRWSLSYLNSLQQRGKWVNRKENLKLGDMVLIREENLPPCKWLLGRVVKLYPGQDKIVRVVEVKTNKGIFKRSVSKLSILPIENCKKIVSSCM